MKRACLLSLAILACVALTIPGCGKEDQTPATAKYINTKCPIMGAPIDPARVTPDLVRDYGAGPVAFCSAGCPEKWDALPEAQKLAKLAAATEPPKPKVPDPNKPS